MANPDKKPRVTETPAERFERVVKAVEDRQERAEERRRHAKDTRTIPLDKNAPAIP